MGYLELYLKRRLEALGYPAATLDLHQCSGFVQGSGVAWYGKLSVTQAVPLIQRMIASEAQIPSQTVYQRLSNKVWGKRLADLFEAIHDTNLPCMEITAKGDKRDGCHHAYSMGMEDCLDWREVAEHYAPHGHAIDVAPIADALMTAHSRMWGRFLSWLREDIQRTSLAIHDELQDIQLASFSDGEVVWERETQRYRVTVTELPCDDTPLDYEEEEELMEMLTLLAQGDHRLSGLQARVKDRQTGKLLAYEATPGFVYPRGDRRYDGVLADIVATAIDIARHDLAQPQATQAA